MYNTLKAIFRRGAVKSFDPVTIPQSIRQQILEWMRTAAQDPKTICDFERKSKFVKWFFVQGWFGTLGALRKA